MAKGAHQPLLGALGANLAQVGEMQPQSPKAWLGGQLWGGALGRGWDVSQVCVETMEIQEMDGII